MRAQHVVPKLPRTELERRIRERGMTYGEFVEFAERFARENGEVGTLSVRHLQRLASGIGKKGKPLGAVRPATARLLERILGAGIDELLGPSSAVPNPSSDLFQLLTAASRIDRSVIALLREQLSAIRTLDRQLGAVIAHEEVKTKEDQVNRLRSHSLTPDVRSELGALQAELCTLAGWQALDLGRVADAWNFYERGKAVAAEASDPAYLMHVRAEQAFVMLEIGKSQDAVRVLESLPVRHTSPILRAWTFAALGEAFAATGDALASQGAFDKSAAMLSVDSENEGPYVALDSVHLARWRGHALARLGLTEATDLLSSALRQLDPTFARAATSLRVDLGTAYLAMGEPEEARRHIDVAASTAAEIGSIRQQKRIASLLT